MKYKLIASDFDGTIYTSDYKIADGTKEAMKEYMDKGGKIVISTGRLYASIKKQMLEMGLDKGEVIVYQGSGVYDVATDKPILEYNIDTDVATECLRFIDDREGFYGLMYYEGKCYVPERNMLIDFFLSILKVDDTIVTGMRMSDYIAKNAIKPTKILLLSLPDKQGDIADECREKFSEYLTFSRANEILVEVVNKDASKGNALRYVAEEMYGLTRDEVIAIGDAENDISMIEYAGLGVAMGNAMDELKAVADLVTITNDESGVAKIIREYGLGDKQRVTITEISRR